MTAEQLPADCTPDWTDDSADEPPDPGCMTSADKALGS